MSEVWAYFKKVGIKAKCKLCSAELSRTQANTKGMWRHLECEHHAIYIKLKKGSIFGSKLK
jgi:hypothetical protein